MRFWCHSAEGIHTLLSQGVLSLVLSVLIGCAWAARSQQPRSLDSFDVVAPVGTQTLVELAGMKQQKLSVRANSFMGRATIGWDSQAKHNLLVLVPDQLAGPADVSVLRDGELSQTITVFPVPTRGSQDEVALESVAVLPDPASREYTLVTQSTQPFAGKFNGQDRKSLRHIQISGYRVVIEPGGKQGIFERLMPGGKPAADIASVEIYAKELILAAPIELPGSTVKIFAQSLEIRDRGTTLSSITTTPLPMAAETNAGQPGSDGQRGGDISLHVARFEDRGQQTARFIVTGGAGQQGGPQTDGNAGVPRQVLPHELQIGGIVRDWNNIQKEFHGTLPVNWERYETAKNVVWFQRLGTNEWGTRDVWPGNGEPGKAGGKPGIGGAGGTVHSTLPLREGIVAAQGGASGAQPPAAQGGPAGEPAVSIGIWIENRVKVVTDWCSRGRVDVEYRCERRSNYPVYHFYTHQSTPGPNVESPAADAPHGASGIVVTDLQGWLPSASAQAVLAFTEDLYRLGFLTQAHEELVSLQQALSSSDGITGDAGAYVAVRQRVSALLARQSSNLDYFGNPGGWVPLLDFPATLRVLQAEVNQSGRILLLTEQLRIQAEEGKAQASTLRTSRDAAAEQIRRLESRLDALANQVPRIQKEAEEVASEEKSLLKAIQDREAQLERDAEALANPRVSFLKQALKTLGAVAKVFPVAQPILGAVGGALDFVSSIDEGTPWDAIQKVPSIASGFSAENIDASLRSYKKMVGDIESMDPARPKEFFSQVSGAATAMGNSLAEFRRIQDASRAPASAVDAILQKLKAQDPSLTDFVNRASELNRRKTKLAQALDHSIHELGEVTSEIASLTRSIDVLNRQLAESQDWVDHPGIVAASSIGHLLRTRLDYYHYLVIKAYEYYSAQPYSRDRRAAGTAESLLEILRKHNNDPAAAAEAYATAYINEVRGVGQQIVQRLADVGPGRQKQITVPFTKSQLAELNRMITVEGPGSADLYVPLEDLGIFPVTDLEARLVKVEVSQCQCEVIAGGDGGANIQIDVAAAPRGIIRTKDRTIGFLQSTGATAWGASVDLTTRPAAINPIRLPEDVGRVLATLFNMPALDSYATAPPVLPGVFVRARLFGAGATNAKIKDLRDSRKIR